MSRKVLLNSALLAFVPLVALLAYSLDRTSWLFTMMETGQDWAGGLGLSAALVIELSVIALIIGHVLAELDWLPSHLRFRLGAWASWGLGLVTGVTITANLLAGYFRGLVPLQSQFQEMGSLNWFTSCVLWGSWFLSNFTIPALIFIIAKIQATLFVLVIQSSGDQKPLDEPSDLVYNEDEEKLPQEVTPPLLSASPIEAEIVPVEAPMLLQEQAKLACPFCDRELATYQAVSAARRHKGCPSCRSS